MISPTDLSLIIDRYVNNLESLAKLSKEYHISFPLLKEELIKKGIKIRNKTESLQKYVKYSSCIICGRQFRMRERWDSTTNHHNKTCGNSSCLHELRSEQSKAKWTDDRKEMMSKKFMGRSTDGWNIPQGDQRANWKGGYTPSYYRHLAFEVYNLEAKCIECGTTENLCVHHKDRNRNNNAKENLEIRCQQHHTGLHSNNGDCGFKMNGYNETLKNTPKNP